MKKLKAPNPLSLRMPPALREKVEEMAAKESRTLTNMTIVLLQRAIENQSQADARV